MGLFRDLESKVQTWFLQIMLIKSSQTERHVCRFFSPRYLFPLKFVILAILEFNIYFFTFNLKKQLIVMQADLPGPASVVLHNWKLNTW